MSAAISTNISDSADNKPLVSGTPDLSVLELRELTCERADRSLFSGLNVQLKPGQLLELNGPNGSGKSTLLRIIAGLSDAFTGQVLWREEQDHLQQGQLQDIRDCRLAFQENCLYQGHAQGIKRALTALENLRWSTELKGAYDESIAQAALKTFQLQGYEHTRCGALSAGQQRRVSLARLITTGAKLWLLDEPYTALDRAGIASLNTLFSEHIHSGGSAIVATHQPIEGFPALLRLSL